MYKHYGMCSPETMDKYGETGGVYLVYMPPVLVVCHLLWILVMVICSLGNLLVALSCLSLEMLMILVQACAPVG
jgi:cytochrome c-type biogenesis protein CcmH/NrfF